jgi:hypothetical protein
MQSRDDGVKYTDYATQIFLKWRKTTWFADTVFVI